MSINVIISRENGQLILLNVESAIHTVETFPAAGDFSEYQYPKMGKVISQL